MYNYEESLFEKLIMIVIYALLGTMLLGTCFLLFSFFVAMFGEDAQIERTHLYNEQIVSLKDGSETKGSISGSLFAVRGVINGEDVVRGYKVNQDGSYTAFNLPMNKVKIYESDASPRIEVWQYQPTNDSVFAKPCYECDNDGLPIYWYDVYVPKGSIAHDFELDSE